MTREGPMANATSKILQYVHCLVSHLTGSPCPRILYDPFIALDSPSPKCRKPQTATSKGVRVEQGKAPNRARLWRSRQALASL